ncbi:MAG: efflux RND transporter permease subunit, partial [bacterium]|nr:efflux RND transporter permease subunit [bacterium]
MKLPEFSVNRPVFTLMIFAGILLSGIVSLILLPIDLMPKIEMPTMSVITTYPGASAEDVETKVTKIIESSVSTAPNIKEVSSTSMENISAVTLRFEWGTNLDEVSNDVRQMLDFASRRLPDDAESPMLVKFDFSMMPIIVFGITAKESYNDLYKIVEENFCDPLKRVPGVASTMIMGGLIREIQVNIDRQQLEARHIPIGQVTGILAAENFSLPAGDIKIGRTDYIVRVPGEFKTVDEIDNVVVGSSKMGTPIYLKDVASIEDTYKEKERFTRVNRGKGIIVMVQKQSGANTVTVADDIRKALPDIEKSLPPDVKALMVMDTSDFIKRSITNLASTVGWALLFVLLIVFIFLREIRGSIIIALTIPFSLIVAFIFLFAGDFTINIMTLSAIAIAIGMVVDNAIVIFENTYRHRAEEGDSRRESAIFGSSEVGTAITASTLTTIAIFLPVLFVKGLVGIMFKELALVVIIVLAASLFCSLTFTPMLASRMLRLPSEVKIRSGWLRRFRDFSEKLFDGLENAYKTVLNWVLSHRKTTIIAGVVIFGVSLLLFKVVGTEFMPEMDQSQFSGNITMPIGTRVEVTNQALTKIEDIIEEEIPESELMFASCGKSESGMGAVMGRISD